MKKRGHRQLLHQPYYALQAYQLLIRKSDAEMADVLSLTERTYREKVMGHLDFTSLQGRILSSVFAKSEEDIFLT